MNIEVEDTWGSFLKKLAGTVTKEFMNADLNFEGCISVVLVYFQIIRMDERDGLIGAFRRENVA